MRSTEACPPPVTSRASAIPRNATASSIPSGAKNFGHSTPKIAVSITHVIRKAPTRVNNPSKTKTPPINSPNAAAPIHNHAGRMNEKGAGKEMNFVNPGPLNEPRTFCAPCPMNGMPSARRKGTGAHEEEVAISLRNISSPLSETQGWSNMNYKSVFVCRIGFSQVAFFAPLRFLATLREIFRGHKTAHAETPRRQEDLKDFSVFKHRVHRRVTHRFIRESESAAFLDLTCST